MKTVFLGVGEAFDENYPNNSSLIITDNATIMIDCGDAAVRQLWRYIARNNLDFNFPDALYITHRHSDHLFGFNALFSRMHEEKRTKPFTVICSSKLHKDLANIAQYAYNGLETNFPYELRFIDIEPESNLDFMGLKLSFARLGHSTEDIGIKISDGKNSVCYSGDGPIGPEAESLYHGADLVIQEVYLLDQRIIGHECIIEAIAMAKRNNVKNLALVHLNKHFRRKDASKVLELIAKENLQSKVNFLLPIPFDEINLG